MTEAPFWPDGYLDGCTIEGFYSLKSLELHSLGDKREIYFLGENGDGKTLLLQALVLALKHQSIEKDYQPSKVGKALDLLHGEPEASLRVARLRTKPQLGSRFLVPDGVFAYGVNRSRCCNDDWEPHGFMTLFDELGSVDLNIAHLAQCTPGQL